MSPAPELRGPRVRLVPVRPEHREALRALHHAPEVRRWWQEPDAGFPDPADATEQYAVLVAGEVAGFIQWAAEEDPMYRHASVDVFLGPAHTGRGLGTEAVRLLCAHLVDDHAFHRLTIDPDADNHAAIGAYAKVGFRPVGVLRRYARHEDGTWHDGLLMDLLAEELVRQ